MGQTTLISTPDPKHEVRTGVTAILPRGKQSADVPVFGAWFALNGNGEMTGTTWLEEGGRLEGPVMLTNTHSVGVVHDAVIAWRVRLGPPDPSGYWWSSPVVAETWDSYLNDINGFHVRPQDVDAALDSARGGPVAEGNVGGGTGMICHEFKCGIGTASRRVMIAKQPYVLGVLVQANYGVRDTLRIAGVPVGQHLRQAPFVPGECARSRRHRLDHHRRGHRCSRVTPSTQAHRAPCRDGPGTQWQLRRQRLGGYFRRILHRKRRRHGE